MADHDAYLWLEEIDGERALNWVREANAKAQRALAQDADFAALQSDIRAVLDDDAKIPFVTKIGGFYYNFWQDAAHPRGIWRRTTWEEYQKAQPVWETVLDIDALNADEGENWVWHGAQVLRPDCRRALIDLSRGGADADVTREFDLHTLTFVADGFYRPEAKGSMQWIDENHVFVQTDFGADSLTASGYPREARLWTRGTALADAQTVYRGAADDLSISAFHDDTPGYVRDFVIRSRDFYRDELYLRHSDGQLEKIDAPDSVEKSVWRDRLLFSLREDWTIAGTTYPAGAYLAAHFDDWRAGKREITALFIPDARSALDGVTFTKNYLIFNILQDVKNTIVVLDPQNGWAQSPLPHLPAIGSVYVGAVDSDESDDLWLISTGYTEPTTLALTTPHGTPRTLKTLPAFFDAQGIVSEQHFATSRDGTKIPYFLIRREDAPLDGQNPTLLYGYGGFEIPLTPAYSGSIGRAWLTRQNAQGRSGVYAVANIRGGGEYGPRWHQAALRDKRHKAYEDFAAVAQDLIAKNITSPNYLSAEGGSNGGLLTGNMLTQYPHLFGAIVIQVPLLDMRRYHTLLAGASWMAEYGDPDNPDDWAWLQKYSPYHNLDADTPYPPVLLATSTRDDRVHPAHARKMAAKMAALGKTAYYYENIEGGHGGAADNAQRAYMAALTYAFLWQTLGKNTPQRSEA